MVHMEQHPTGGLVVGLVLDVRDVPDLRPFPSRPPLVHRPVHVPSSPKERRKKRKKESTNEFEKEGGVSRAKREEREGSEKGVRRE